MALIIESTFISKTAVSLQIKVHEVYVKPLKPREPVLSIEDSGNEETRDLNISEVEED